MAGIVSDETEAAPSMWLAWRHLVVLSFTRHARMRQMLWIALCLLIISATLLAINQARGRSGMTYWRWFWSRERPFNPFAFLGGNPKDQEKGKKVELGPDGRPPGVVSTYKETTEAMEVIPHLLPWQSPAAIVQSRVADAWRRALAETGFFVFSNWFVFTVFIGFLLPIWALSFSVEAFGGEREDQSLVWLLTRPLPRWSIYLAKFFGLLPWSLAFTLGGFAILCLAAGKPGSLALRLYWPAVMGGTITFCSVFHFLAVSIRRAAVVGLVYSFFLETILGMMPGYMKRASLSFYIRCAMFDAASGYGVQPEKSSVYLPVDGVTAWSVMAIVSIVFVCLGMLVFSRAEYRDLA